MYEWKRLAGGLVDCMGLWARDEGAKGRLAGEGRGGGGDGIVGVGVGSCLTQDNAALPLLAICCVIRPQLPYPCVI